MMTKAKAMATRISMKMMARKKRGEEISKFTDAQLDAQLLEARRAYKMSPTSCVAEWVEALQAERRRRSGA
jgi:hypothetical protein